MTIGSEEARSLKQDGRPKKKERSDGLTTSIRWKRNNERYDEKKGSTIGASGNR